jgi:hypothetical protein
MEEITSSVMVNMAKWEQLHCKGWFWSCKRSCVSQRRRCLECWHTYVQSAICHSQCGTKICTCKSYRWSAHFQYEVLFMPHHVSVDVLKLCSFWIQMFASCVGFFKHVDKHILLCGA